MKQTLAQNILDIIVPVLKHLDKIVTGAIILGAVLLGFGWVKRDVKILADK